MDDKNSLTPILKTTLREDNPLVSRRRSVTFRKDPTSSPEDEKRSPKKEHSKNKFPKETKIQMTDFGLCYTPEDEPTPSFAIHPKTAKVISKELCKRPELLKPTSRVDQYNVVMFGDAIHGKCLKKQLEDYPETSLKISLFASPTKDNVLPADFIFILLPLEIIGSCSRADSILQGVLSQRADGSLRCAVVGVSTSTGIDQHVTELLNLHTLLLQHSLSYYIWSDASPGSWPGIVRRLAAEVVSCGEDRGALPRLALCSLLWPSDSRSFLLQQYLDQMAHRTGLDLNYE